MNDEMSPDARPATWLDKLARAALYVAGLALCCVVVVQGWQVVARYVFNDSPGWTEPVAVLLLSTAMSFAAAAAVHGNNHFSFPLLLARLPPVLQRASLVLIDVVIAGFGAALAFWGTQLWWDGIGVPMAGTDLPQSAAYLPLSLGGALMVLFALARLRHRPESV